MKHFILLITTLCSLSLLNGADYYLAVSGNDSAKGSKEAPFATFKKGLSVLKAGDTLNIAPGDYAGAGSMDITGTREKPVIIRAQIPGTVVIRGDKVVKGFKQVPGEKFAYEVFRNEPVGGVKERDTLSYYYPVSSFEELKNSRAVWFHDTKKKKLYVVTSDGRAPDAHLVTVCGGDPKEGHGLQLLRKSQYVHIDGLNFTGFDSYIVKWGNNYYTIKSLYLNHSSNIKVTNCRVFLNGSGLTFWEGRDSLVENCVSYANWSLAVGSAANIYFQGPTRNCTVRNCMTFKSHLSGIRFYSGSFPDCVIERCVSWGHGMSDLEIKYPDKRAVIRESIGLKNATNTTVRNNITNANSYRLTPEDDPTTIYWRKQHLESHLANYLADFDNFDGRPMSDSKIKRGLPFDKSVYFLSPAGADTNHGNSIRAPRKTLKNIPDGATVYLMPGSYGKLEVTQKNITIAGRGRYTQALVSAFAVKGADVTVRKINFMGKVSASGKNVKFENCSFAGDLDYSYAKDFAVTHCAFVKGTVKSVNSTGAVFSNILAAPAAGKNVYSDNNAYPANVPAGEKRSIVCKALFKDPAKGNFTLKNAGAFAGHALDALPIGPYNRVPGVPGKGIQFAKVHRVTPESAELQWYLPTGREKCVLSWKTGKEKTAYATVTGEVFRTMTITGLKPGKSYTCTITGTSAPDERFLNVDNSKENKISASTVQLTFKTPLEKAPAKEFFVSVKGSDTASGTEEAPFKTIGRALKAVSPGDTVTLREGTYSEKFDLPVSNLTLRGVEGEKVWLDGRRKLLNFITFHNKHNITIDNLRMKGVITTKKEYIRAVNSTNVKLSRLFFDGRWANGYAPTPLYALACKNFLVENCVTMSSFRGLHFIATTGITVRNCVLSMNSLNQIHFNDFPENFNAVIENNIICDMITMKLPNAMVHAPHTHPNLKIANNCFYTRLPAEKRNFVGTWSGPHSGLHPIAHYRKAHPGKETNIFKDPLMPGLKLHKPPFAPGVSKKEYRATPDGKSWEILDFKDFFPADPEVRRRGMGLQENKVR